MKYADKRSRIINLIISITLVLSLSAASISASNLQPNVPGPQNLSLNFQSPSSYEYSPYDEL